MGTLRILRAVLVGVLLWAGSGCGQSSLEEPRPDIVFLLVDALRKDHLGCYGYERDTTPVIDGLANDGLLFENTIAQASWTVPSLASVFTSKYPQFPSAPKSRDGTTARPRLGGGPLIEKALTLAEILEVAGYRTISVSTNPYSSDQFQLMQGFQTRLLELKASAGWVIDQAIEQTEAHLAAGGTDRQAPLFLYLHFMDIHSPLRPPAPYDTLFPAQDPPSAERRHDGEPAVERELSASLSRTIALYDGALRFVDAQIGRFMKHLMRIGMYDNLLLVIVADHGEALGDHSLLERQLGLQGFSSTYGVGHGHTLFPELTEVPLIFHGRGIPRGRVPQQVRNIDITPTLLAVAGVAHEEFHPAGIDLIGGWKHGALENLLALSETVSPAGAQKSLQSHEYQYLRLPDRELLFDKRTRTLVDVSRDHPELLDQFRRETEAIVLSPILEERFTVAPDAGLREALRALGYTE